MRTICFLLLLFVGTVHAEEPPRLTSAAMIQASSVTVKSGRSEGSGTMITQIVQLKEGSKDKVTANFILTAGHVVDDLRTVRDVITSEGKTVKVIEFEDAAIVKEYRQMGRRVGESKMECRVIAYSDADHGNDLALLLVRQYGFEGVDVTTTFKTNDMVDVGTDLLHCGSLLGQMGANSMTKGIMSQQGRVHDGKVYDQTTVSAFPGSSGGGVYILRGDGQPLYVGMITRGAGETFNLMVPMRRMLDWAEDMDVTWIFDPSIPVPTMEEIDELPVEINKGGSVRQRSTNNTEAKEWIFLDGEHSPECWWSSSFVPEPPH